jgi:hypothetical protein
MDDGSMAHRDTLTDGYRIAWVGMQTNEVLDVGKVSDSDRIGIPSHHCTKKNSA